MAHNLRKLAIQWSPVFLPLANLACLFLPFLDSPLILSGKDDV